MTAAPPPAGTRRLVLAGKGRIACEVLDYARHAIALWRQRWIVLGLPTQGDTGEDSWEPSLSARCRALGVPTTGSVAAAGLGPGDLLLSLQYDKIIRMPDLGGAAAYNLHFSALPQHRGCYPGIWALRSGDAQAGVSLHILTAGIDDGAVVDQSPIPIDESTTARELYDQMHRSGAALVRRHLANLLLGSAQAREQDHSAATYHDRRSIDFTQRELPFETLDTMACSRLARSLIFPPFQHPTIRSRAILSCDVIPDFLGQQPSGSEPRIQPMEPNLWLLRCRDGWLRVQLAPQDASC